MAETLDTNRMLANAYEPLRQFRWILEIDGIDAFTAKTAQRPKRNHEHITIDWINEKRFLAGKSEWQTINIELHNPIAPSASQKVMEWMRLVADDATGRNGYASLYKKDFHLKILDPGGVVVEKWKAKGAWPQNVDFGDLDYASNETLTVKFECRCDKWFQVF